MKKTKLKSIRLEMVLAISLLSIALCAAYFGVSVTLSRSAISTATQESLSKISHQSAALIYERVNSHYEKLSSVATNDLFWSAHISESRLYALLKRVQTERKATSTWCLVNNSGVAYNGKGETYPIGDNESYHRACSGRSPSPTPCHRRTATR